MKIIKEIFPTQPEDPHHALCIIRTNTYAKSFEHFKMLVDIAKKDFPTLQDCDIEIVHYAGERYRKTFGIEFEPPSEVPDSYQEISRLEYTLG